MKRWVVLGSLLLAALLPLSARVASGQTVARGAIVSLKGTVHIWIGDDSGVLHWAGDTRSLSGKFVDWGNRREVTLDELKALSRGDPWLSTGLVKIGDPIYFAKWETDASQPELLHIQSISDVELYGINASNYGAMVLDETAWNARFGFTATSLKRGVLASAQPTPAVGPTATATPATLKATLTQVKREDNGQYAPLFEITGATPKTELFVSATLKEHQAGGARSDSWGPIGAGITDSNGKVLWTDNHGAYESATYTFLDKPASRTVQVKTGNDLNLGLGPGDICKGTDCRY